MLVVLLIFVSMLGRRVRWLGLGLLLVFGAGSCDAASCSVSSAAVCVGNAGAAAGARYESPSMP